MNRTICCGLLPLLCLVLTSCTTGTGNHNPVTSTYTPIVAIAATSGTPQSHAVNGAFGQPLVATVTTNGAPEGGITVTFTAPSTGASGTFSDSTSTTANAITDSTGIATSPAFLANGTAGAYTVMAAVSGVPTPASFSLANTTGPPAAITATSGTPQSTAIDTAFSAPLVATVVDSGQNPVSGALVTFTAPATGAGGGFANTMTNTTTATTNANGVAISAPFTADGTSGSYTVTASVAGVTAPANFSLTNSPGAAATITATGGTPQTAEASKPFTAPLVATVLDGASNPVSGVLVTFTAPTTGASGTFTNGTSTETDITTATGTATSSTFTANATVGGPYTVTASISALSTVASFSLTNREQANTYVFWLSGQESFGPNFYALVGSIEVDAQGDILAGEQDYNDGTDSVFTSPEPSGDTILPGTAALAVNATTGLGTLTLTTNNLNLGVGGVETLGVQFVNSSHALIIQFDGTATSSGSLDLQTLPSELSGGYAFTFSGVDNFYGPVEYGGVFSIAGGTTLQNGFLDTNDNGDVTMAAPLTGTLSTFDSFGRGTITSTLNYQGTPVALNYYVVGPEAIRLIDVDPTDSAVGSAFGQGVNATSSGAGSLGTSVFGIEGSPYPINYATVGMFTTTPSASSFSGVADDNEQLYGLQLPATPITGNYSIASNGYGSLTIAAGDLGDVSVLGLYMTDPNLNLNDPNNTSGLGGALLADMDAPLPGGTGVLVSQTSTSSTSFTGAYAFGAQDFNDFCCEFDFVAQGSVTKGVLKGTGLLSDPFLTLDAAPTNSGVTFSGTPLADKINLGRYTMLSTNTKPNPFEITINGTAQDFDVVIYQASGGFLFWLDEDTVSVFLGSLQQQGSFTGLPATRKAPAKAEAKQKQ
jgi:hypothetical protein